jgi:hypothetical protein
MFSTIIVLITTAIISFLIINRLKDRYNFIDSNFLRNLFFYHFLLTVAYYGYAVFNPSDSHFYYHKILVNYRGDTWWAFYGTSTKFIEFVGYPFVKYLAFSYEAIMVMFSFFGFLGFVYFYIFFRENVRFKHELFGFDLMKIIFFLPNLHFWSSSFGKGSLIFFGLGLFFYGLSSIRTRLLAIVLGGIIIYEVRPHVMLVILVSCALSLVFGTKGISNSWRFLFLAGATAAFFFIYKDVLAMVAIDESEFLSQGLDLTHRASELSKATSGIDIASYSLPFQVFTFLYRPLFIDAPGVLGLIVSFENVFYLAVTLKLVGSLRGIKYLITGSFLSKSAFISFITISIALAQVSGNLGLAMRQKSQVMILLLFVILTFLDSKKLGMWKAYQLKKLRMARKRETIVPAT